MNLNDKDLSSMLQAVIDAPALQPYLHPEQPGRTPLIVVAQFPGIVELRKFGQPVVVTAKADPGKPALELDVKQISAGATVAFRYPAEGITGTFDLGTDDLGRWNVRRHELHEK